MVVVVSPSPSAQASPAPIRVASVPSTHVYVRHLAPTPGSPGGHRVTRLPDPDPADPERFAGARWWPPVMLEPEWLAGREDFDLMHLQFGFDAVSPKRLAQVLDVVRGRGSPFVYTAHDLRNPHHRDRHEHDAQLAVLMTGADAVVTLTAGAASEIATRWGRTAQVIPHPHVVDVATMRRVRRRREALFGTRPADAPEQGFRVGVHVKSLRASMDPAPVIEALLRAVADLPGAVLQVNGHTDVLDASGARYDSALARLLERAQSSGAAEVRVHDFLPDAELWSYLASLDVSVLPYRFGTHSGWLEACRDLGTAVIAPDCGYYRDQAPIHEYHHDEDGLDADSLIKAVVRAYESPRAPAESVEARERQRSVIADAHLELYRTLLSQ